MAGPKFDWNQFPTEQDAAKTSGAKFDWNSFESITPKGPSKTETGLRQGASGVVAGFDDEFGGVIGAAGRLAGVKNLGSWKPFDPDSRLEKSDKPLSADEIVNAYRENRDTIREDQHKDFETNPGTAFAGNIAGAIVSPLGKLKSADGVTKAGKIGSAMKTAAMQGAVFGAGSSESDLTKGEVGDFVKDVAINTAVSAAIPPALEVGKVVAKKGAQSLGWASKKLFSSTFDISEKNAEKYLARRAQVNAAPEFEALKNSVDDTVLKISNEVDNGKTNLADAKKALSDLKSQVQNQLADAKVDAREAVKRADDMLKDASAKVLQPLKDKRAPTGMANDLVDAVDELKRSVLSKSDDAWGTLEKSTKTLPKSVIQTEVDNAIAKMKIGGNDGGVVGDKAEAAVQSLTKLKNQIAKLPDNLSMSDVKVIVKSLGDDVSWQGAAGSFMDAASKEKSGIRYATDKYLKTNVPEYADAMKPLAKETGLLSEASKAFGDERKAIGRIGQVAGPKGSLDRQMIADLEAAIGREGSFTKPIDDYVRVQKILKDPAALDAIQKALPEHQAYRQAMAKLAKLKPNWTREQLARALATSKEARALQLAQSAITKAEEAYAPISTLTPGSTESKLRSFGKPSGVPIETRKAFEALEKQSGKNFAQLAEDRALLESFNKASTNGSKNTLLGGVIGFVLGGLPGLAWGPALGVLKDKYGPKMGKAVLDGIGRIREAPSIQTIRSLELPQSVKSELEREFRIYMTVKKGTELAAERRVAKKESEQSAPKGEDKWAMDGASKLGLTDEQQAQLMKSPQGKRLLIEASDLQPGSPAMNRIMEQIRKGNQNDTFTSDPSEVLHRGRRPSSGR